jgi:hypothetical protein
MARAADLAAAQALARPRKASLAALLGDKRDEEWELLLRPVTDWSVGAKDARFMAAANSPLAAFSRYSDAVLFDQRTEADDSVLAVAAPVDQAAPADDKAAPAVEDKAPESAEAAPLAGAAARLFNAVGGGQWRACA